MGLSDRPIEVTIKENYEALFNIKALFQDWLREQTCGYDEQRIKITAALNKVRGNTWSGEYSDNAN